MATSKHHNEVIKVLRSVEQILTKLSQDDTCTELYTGMTIVAAASKVTGISQREILTGRNREHADIRKMVMHIMHSSGYTLSRIGNYFDRHHTTVIYAIGQHHSLYRYDATYADTYNQIIQKIKK
ncbi:MAG TPA: helix-turn-helix domain-containing protein [Saprospiraceae bacterium]|jgi:chromosomal replication initiation ATPase DnaA|nr:helix-turn-helix domain-containing protein [Saprospiraceae bacterium]HRP41977.1 helix-turn-helix domain-containing protein [Saprospiraceae bacterium]